MSDPRKIIKIETRTHLLSTLAEAAELEHTLMCLYLYAVFGLKQATDEDLTAAELAAVKRWRGAIMQVAVQEMTHFALVANLTTALGGSAHFHRPNFPVSAGYFPAGFVVELAPFDRATLDHFIFLERPEGKAVEDGDSFQSSEVDHARPAPRHRLMAHTGEYETVGQLYQAIEDGIVRLSDRIGDAALFCGPPTVQLAPSDVKLDGLAIVHDRNSALSVLQTIVEQGEGARNEKGSHFEKFNSIKKEYEALAELNPTFKPSRPCARNPVMRELAADSDTVWISNVRAAKFLDLGNALYALMLRCLTQAYAMESRSKAEKAVLLATGFGLMHAIGDVASCLSLLPATAAASAFNAGMTFSLNRHQSPFEVSSETQLLSERLGELQTTATALHCDEKAHVDGFAEVLRGVGDRVADLRLQLGRKLT